MTANAHPNDVHAVGLLMPYENTAVAKRLAVLIPSSNTSVETELGRHLPLGVTLHSSRLTHFAGVDPAAVEIMVDDIERASRLVATAGVDLIFVFATVPSLIRGGNTDEQIARRIEDATGIRATTTSTAMLAALREMNIRRLVLGTPFKKSMNEKIVAFLKSHDFDVLADRGLAIEENLAIGKLGPDSVQEMVEKIDIADADAVLLACTNWQTLNAIDRAERTVGKPVITTTQASLWWVLKSFGLPATKPGLGRLLAPSST